MSLLNLLSLEDDQIEIVTGAVRRWCEENRHSVNSQAGRQAMEVAISLAVSQRTDQSKLESLLAKLMKVRAISGISYGDDSPPIANARH
ncbi:hypothetical protein DTW90_37170 [Neorhizobium sp. P12A]|uniref:hypothetical protein n=1 Tax=Neorhizobium sp. P12A TaxID=2268027 RepID=UPI0011EE3DBB|nr:hypothetical protein [Neorhizobium sp. P12A]KAA0681155.1 hypothetical protein DTW90_37170 [Neorhizobium sp. P12A]